MATEYLLEGATTFAAAGWDGSGIATGNDFIVDKKFGPITAGLDQSSASVESLWFTPGAAGVVGGGSYGPLTLDADNGAGSYVRNQGKVSLYIEAGGGDTEISYFQCGGFSRNYLMGGTFAQVYCDGGELHANASTAITNADMNAGSSTLLHCSTASTAIVVNGGTHHLERMPTTLTINGGRCVVDIDDAATVSGTTMNVNGGVCDWRRGAIPTVNGNGGEIQTRNAKTPFTPGGTAFVVKGSCEVEDAGVINLTNVTYATAQNRSLEGNTPIGG